MTLLLRIYRFFDLGSAWLYHREVAYRALGWEMHSLHSVLDLSFWVNIDICPLTPSIIFEGQAVGWREELCDCPRRFLAAHWSIFTTYLPAVRAKFRWVLIICWASRCRHFEIKPLEASGKILASQKSWLEESKGDFFELDLVYGWMALWMWVYLNYIWISYLISQYHTLY